MSTKQRHPSPFVKITDFHSIKRGEFITINGVPKVVRRVDTISVELPYGIECTDGSYHHWSVVNTFRRRKPRTFNDAGTLITMTTGRVGPRHDPYGFQVISVRRYGVDHDLTGCGLRGCKYEENDEVVVDFCQDNTAVDAFTKATGAGPEVWVRLYERTWQPDPMGSLSSYE